MLACLQKVLKSLLKVQFSGSKFQMMTRFDNSVTNLVRDSGAVLVFTIETTRNSVLIATIFMNCAQKMVGRSYVKALSKKCENIA